jgi:hypothetical protein
MAITRSHVSTSVVVEAAEVVDGFLYRRVDRFAIRYIARDEANAEVGGALFPRFRVQIERHHLGTEARKGTHHSLPHPTRPSGDDNSSAF